MVESRAAEVWSRLHRLAQDKGEPVSLRHACVVCARTVAASGAGLSMARDDKVFEPVFATDVRSRELDELQFTLGEGPSVDAAIWDAPVLIGDLLGAEAAARWPGFTPEAARLRVRSAIALPVRAGAVRLGVLTAYRDEPGVPAAPAVAEALVCADAVLVLALDEHGGISRSLEDLLDTDFATHRARLHQAAGMVSVQTESSLADALARLRAYAFARERPLAEVAAAVLDRRLRFTADHDDTPPNGRRFPLPDGGAATGENEKGKDR